MHLRGTTLFAVGVYDHERGIELGRGAGSGRHTNRRWRRSQCTHGRRSDTQDLRELNGLEGLVARFRGFLKPTPARIKPCGFVRPTPARFLTRVLFHENSLGGLGLCHACTVELGKYLKLSKLCIFRVIAEP